MILNFYSVT